MSNLPDTLTCGSCRVTRVMTQRWTSASCLSENPLVYFDTEERLGHVLDGWVSEQSTDDLLSALASYHPMNPGHTPFTPAYAAPVGRPASSAAQDVLSDLRLQGPAQALRHYLPQVATHARRHAVRGLHTGHLACDLRPGVSRHDRNNEGHLV
jgi:hypothetical protein